MTLFLAGLVLLLGGGWWLHAHRPSVKRPWRVCSWCDHILEFGDEGGYETHTMCPDCLAAWSRNVKKPRIAA